MCQMMHAATTVVHTTQPHQQPRTVQYRHADHATATATLPQMMTTTPSHQH